MKAKIFLVCAFIAVTGFFAFASHRFKSRELNDVSIRFTGNNEPLISLKNVNKLLIQSKDTSEILILENLDLNKSEFRLVENAMIRAAEVSVTLDGRLEAVVEQRKPIARIISDYDQYLDEDNLLMPLSNEHTVRVPLIFGFEEKFQDDIYGLVNDLRSDTLLENAFSSIVIDKQKGYILIPRAYDYEVILGSVKEQKQKLNKYKAFIAKMNRDKQLDKLKTVDLRYKKQVVTTKK